MDVAYQITFILHPRNRNCRWMNFRSLFFAQILHTFLHSFGAFRDTWRCWSIGTNQSRRGNLSSGAKIIEIQRLFAILQHFGKAAKLVQKQRLHFLSEKVDKISKFQSDAVSLFLIGITWFWARCIRNFFLHHFKFVKFNFGLFSLAPWQSLKIVF